MDHGCYKDYNEIYVDDAGYVYPQVPVIFEDILYRYTFADDGMIVDPINEIQDESLTQVFRNEMLIGEIQKREPCGVLKFLLLKGAELLFKNYGKR
jgi:hypothetical protein